MLALGLMGCGETTGTGGSGGDGGVGGDGGDGGNGVACADNVCPCTEAGLRAAIAEGGGPFTFDCDGPTTVVTQEEIVIDNDVILDGEGNLTVDGNEDHTVFMVSEGVTAELHGFGVTNGNQGVENHGNLTVTNSTVSDNTCACVGSGIRNEGSITLTHSTLSGNNALEGGGLHNNNFATATLTNCTVSGNTAARGAGIYNDEGTLTVTSSTVSRNRAEAFSGAGIWNRAGTATLANNVINGDCLLGAAITSHGYNIESPGNTCGFDQTGDQVNVSADDLMLGPLQDNGGPTHTHALLPGSVAIDKIPAEDCVDADGEPLTTDQRGFPRDSMCDVGSFEVQLAAEGCIQSGGTVSTGLCCQAVESFPNTCAIGACGCGPDASHEVAVCICPANTCFDGEGCVAQ
ncbi:MAG: right-handed parallel beta-helix repeat-containing protein [Deltaproteobacteria bacterium]|nr:right-handed parallel beta-helix repeat-containing protein [Deltaproteobacteria bacterium]